MSSGDIKLTQTNFCPAIGVSSSNKSFTSVCFFEDFLVDIYKIVKFIILSKFLCINYN